MLQRHGSTRRSHANQAAPFARKSREWLERPVLLALVTLGHLGLLWVMLQPATPFQTDRSRRRIDDDGSMQLRFIHLHVAPPVAAKPVTLAAPAPIAHVPIRRSAPHVAPAALPETAAAPTPTMPSQLLDTSTPAPAAPGYVAGSNGFQQRLRASENASVPNVPGGDFVPGAPRIPMIEERSAGAMAVHFIGYLFGAPHPHCVDVDTWRGMTPQQLIDAHVSQSDIDRIAAENGCVEPERFKNVLH
ncbi:hypothetical protein [Dyella mobilis]|uniref:Transmembrane protein n=1 Tax=Dyella mobilis TaxID=1849582 RepID=A0ABS2KL42_9GAMM|nr:hypothetical protein [Dyella mobilis]MBM7131887.1 hypothetical protein [Dyella mobilis]GLQ96130.1 hypothetical protein GCM10007863_05480 [Dyella mobilis]